MKTMLWVARSAAALALISFGALSMAADLEEGKDYRRLAKPQATETGKKIEVIEFFSFSCPHCKDISAAVNSASDIVRLMMRPP